MVAAADSKRAYEVERVSYVVVFSTWQEAASSTRYDTGVLVYRTKVLLHELKTTCCLRGAHGGLVSGVFRSDYQRSRMDRGGCQRADNSEKERGGGSCAAWDVLNAEIVSTAPSKAPLRRFGTCTLKSDLSEEKAE